MSTYTAILVEKHDRVGLVRFNRSGTLNALDRTLLSEIMDALEDFDADEEVGTIVITGDDLVFAAGADIKEMAGASPVEMLQRDTVSQFDRIRRIRKPIIAAVSGWCLGGGNELALSCDMVVASEKARFGQPEIKLGVIPGAGGTQRLARAVGKAITMEMVLNNRMLNAEEALMLGLVNKVVPVERYLLEAIEMGNQIATRAPLAVRVGKEMVNLAFELPLSEGLAAERRSFYFLFATQDQKEGMAAFMEKRDPDWKGE